MQLAFSFWIVLVTSAWLSIQGANPNESLQLYPSDSDLVAAAKQGYRIEKNLELYQFQGAIHENPNMDCRPITQTIGVAGPLMLAAMQGRSAYLKSVPAPERDSLLHVKGAVLLSVESYAAKKEDRAEIWLAQRMQQFHPTAEKLEAVNSVTCGGFRAGGSQHTSAAIWDVTQSYVFRFQPDAPQPDWNEVVTVFVRKSNHEEKFEINFRKVFTREATSLL